MRNRTIASLAVVAILAGSVAGYLGGSMNERATTTTSTLTEVSTTTTTLTVQTAELSRSNGNYTFVIRLNGSTVVKGQEISLFYNLTNISGEYQRVQEVSPLVIPTIYSENGSVAWFLFPQHFEYSQAPNISLPNGFSLTSNLLIPTANLSAGQEYVLSIGPLIGPFVGPNDTLGFFARYYPIGDSLMINTTIAVR